VGITPAAGFIPVYVAALVGAITSFSCFYTAKYKYLLRVDEGLDIFAIHGVGGVVGDILTGLFASKNVPAMDGESVEYLGGWWDQHYKQMGYQMAAALSCAAWSFIVSIILLFIINCIPGMHIRASEQEELEGLDEIYLEDGPISGSSVISDGAITHGVGASIHNTSETSKKTDS
jgi:Amt family ammonium transporter